MWEMGCGVSSADCRLSDKGPRWEEADFKLSSARLTFNHRQMMKLNSKFSNLLESGSPADAGRERRTACLGVVVERLIQRLVCNVGNLDSRFSSKFLVNLDPQRTQKRDSRESLKFKYLVRLDLVSTPALYPDVSKPPVRIIEGADDKSLPQGYAKVRIHGELLEQWAGFLSPNGYLRRDKVQERFLELLTKAAARPSEPYSPAQVDESRHCGAPGKIVDPVTLSHILRVPASRQVFFGSDDCNESRFPDPRDFRIAIVEGVPETRLHISFLSPTAQSIASEVEISITFGIGVAGWPTASDYPSRLPLDHVDVVLGYKAAQLGYYLVPRGPHSSLCCEDRASVWEIRALPTEMFLEHHYSPTSVVSRVHGCLLCLLETLKARGVKTVDKYILKNLLFFELEHKRRIQHWKPKSLSRRVLSILDKLHGFLRNHMVPGYVFTEKNLLLQEDAFEDDYVSDREIIEQYLRQLHNDEFVGEVDDSQWVPAKDELENVLLSKWDNVITSMLPPRSNRTKRLSAVSGSSAVVSYTRQQMEYVAVLIREVLKLKNIQRASALPELGRTEEGLPEEGPTDEEDFIYLLQVMFDQAKQKVLASPGTSARKRTSSRKLPKHEQMLLSYDISTSMLLDDIRRNKLGAVDFSDDLSVVMRVMECLYKAMDSDGKVLAPVLRPYLNEIFKGSHENCWFLPEWNKNTELPEFEAIGAFSELVLSRSISPFEGVVNSASKGWGWAANCLRIMEAITEDHSTKLITGEKINMAESGLRLVFAPSPGRTVRCNVPTAKSSGNPNTATDTPSEKNGADSRHATIRSFQDILESSISSGGKNNSEDVPATKGVVKARSRKLGGEKQPFHVQLRDGNPFTMASMETRRQGLHRGLGSIVQALISLQKLTILQEVSQYLPESERTRVLSDIKKLSKEVERVAVENFRRKKSFSLSVRRTRFVVKKTSSPFSPGLVPRKRISRLCSTGLEKSSPLDVGTYRSVNEFSAGDESDEIRRKVKNREDELEAELRNVKEESLRGTCRQLRKASRPTAFGSRTSCTFPKAGHFRRGSSKSAINTPFYIKVSSFGCTLPGDRTAHSKPSKK